MSCLSPMFSSFWTQEPLESSKQRPAGKICTFLRPIEISITWPNCQFHEHFSLHEFHNFKTGFWTWEMGPRQPKENLLYKISFSGYFGKWFFFLVNNLLFEKLQFLLERAETEKVNVSPGSRGGRLFFEVKVLPAISYIIFYNLYLMLYVFYPFLYVEEPIQETFLFPYHDWSTGSSTNELDQEINSRVYE